jgi:hypothetical protein
VFVIIRPVSSLPTPWFFAALVSVCGSYSFYAAHMPVFPSRPLNPSRLNTLLRKQPLFFGVPFIALMVATSFGLATVTQVKYDVRDQRVKQVCSSSRSFVTFLFSSSFVKWDTFFRFIAK